jgi:SAM-dependent methyltransferase
MREENKLFLFLEKLPAAHALARACECQAVSQFELERPILDLGCGEGIFGLVCFGKGQVEAGVDRSKRELVLVQKSGVYKKTVLADAVSLPFRNGSFQSVVSNCVLEHIEPLDQVLAEVWRVLKKGGQFVFTVPTPWLGNYFLFSRLFKRMGLPGLASGYARLKNRLWGHVNLRRQVWWESRLKKAGFAKAKSASFAAGKITAICDFLAFLAWPSFIFKKLTGKWWLGGGWGRVWFWQVLLGGLDLGETKKGATFIFQAIK